MQTVQNNWLVIDWNKELVSTSAWQILEAKLRDIPSLARTPNTICDLISPNGHVLSIGFAQPRSSDNPSLENVVACVNYQLPSGDPPYSTVKGHYDSSLIVVFRSEDNQWTEIPLKNCVSPSFAIDIAKRFFESETLPDVVDWQEL